MPETFNLFPELFAFSLISPFILRVVLGFIFLNLGLLKLSKERPGWISALNILNIHPASFFASLLGIIEIVGGLLLIVGAYTQITALVLAIIALCELFIEYKEESILKRDFVFYLLLTTICLSLLLTGAGLFAVDIPLL
ncbi:MAG: DoxX family protein [Candidatus Paceibacterota bacterium]